MNDYCLQEAIISSENGGTASAGFQLLHLEVAENKPSDIRNINFCPKIWVCSHRNDLEHCFHYPGWSYKSWVHRQTVHYPRYRWLLCETISRMIFRCATIRPSSTSLITRQTQTCHTAPRWVILAAFTLTLVGVTLFMSYQFLLPIQLIALAVFKMLYQVN